VIDWDDKEWATQAIDRAEARDAEAAPALHQRGKVLLAWPGKLTFAPALADRVLEWLTRGNIAPSGAAMAAVSLPEAETGHYPWEVATWKKI
jgi:hypothetical protein